MFAMTIGGMLGGTIVVENIFAWQGVGKLAMEAISNRDYPLIMGTTIFYSIVLVTMILIVDILYTVVDPRIKLSNGGE